MILKIYGVYKPLFFSSLVYPIFYDKGGVIIKDYSEQFEQYYESEDVIYCKDPKQQKLYLKHHAKLADIFYNDIDDRVVLVFWRNETKELYKKWKAHELE